MPWKGEKDPYKIWLSEIILQQTRVDQGLKYYESFVRHFPRIKDLAEASETRVFKLWEGLGYYSRCKNLHITAKYIYRERGGQFPDTYEELIRLKGVGPYTAAAIASFSFKLPYAVLDGNVYRVLARYIGYMEPVDTVKGKKYFSGLAATLLDKKNPDIYNQAIMDFGATVCKPAQPLCLTCPLKTNCVAFQQERQNIIPRKEKQIKRKKRWFYYYLFEQDGDLYVQKRPGKDIWENLYQFYLYESNKNLSLKDLKNPPFLEKTTPNAVFISISRLYKQALSHQDIWGRFIQFHLKDQERIRGMQKISRKKLLNLPFPKFIVQFLKDKKYL